MPKFYIEAFDPQGTLITETREAESAYAAVSTLREQGYQICSARPAGWTPLFSRPKRPLSSEELSLLSEQLATLVGSGLPFAASLDEMAGALRNRRLASLLGEVQDDLQRGRSLEEAFGRHADQLPPVFLSLLRAGEQTGNLPAVLRQITDYTQGLLRLKYRLQAIFAYPTLLLVFLMYFMGMFVCYVVPQFETLYAYFGRSLPGPTAWLMFIAQVTLIVGYPLAFLFLLLMLGSVALGHALPVRSHLGWLADNLRLRIPLVGGMYRTVLAARFCRTLGILLSNGANALESLHLAGVATGNRVYARAAHTAARHVANGERLSDAIADTGILRPSACWILTHGENHGALEATLLRLAETSDRDAERREQRLLGVLGPSMVWVFGLVVGFTVYALFLPIFQLSSLVR